MNEKKVDIAPLLRKVGIEVQSAEILETPGMYPYKEKIEENWAYYTAVGFQRLKALLEPEQMRDVAIVGIGSGVEGILAKYIFGNDLKKLIITDRIVNHIIITNNSWSRTEF